ncbi:Putative GPH family transporter [Erwinia amylovora Ea644]|nr:Putative GPH family transporter [Erwinia amylovora Ea644]
MLLFTAIPALGYLMTAAVVRLLKVDRQLMQLIQNDLQQRRANYQELNDYQHSKALNTQSQGEIP